MRLSCNSCSGSRPPEGSSSSRRFFFAAKISFARSANPGAAMHSAKSFATSSAVAASTARLNASTPPNAEIGSHASAFKYASSKVVCSAVRQGCFALMIPPAGFWNSAPSPRAAWRSARLLYESSLPWSCLAAANPSGARPVDTYRAAAWWGFSPYRKSCCRRRAICTRSGSAGFASKEICLDLADKRSSSIVINPSYREVVAKTFRASSSRVASVVSPALSISRATRPKSAGSVTTVTLSKFFAADRSIVGPPMSMFSISSSAVSPAFAAVASNGYRFTTTRSIGAIPCSAACFWSSVCPRRKSSPPCTFGCSVFTRPPSISGQPVKSETSRTAIPASRSSLAVPPVERISILSAARRFANSTIPVFSNTLISARCTAMDASTKRKAQHCKRLAQIGKVQTLWGNSARRLRFHECLQFDLACDHFHNVFNILAVLLLLQLLRFLQHKFVEAGARQPSGMFAGQLFRLQKRLVQLLDLFRFALGLGTGHAKCLGFSACNRRCLFGFFFLATRFDLFGSGAKMPLDFSLFFLRGFFPENIFVFCVGLRKIVEAEPLREFQFAAAFRITLDHHVNAPFDFRGRTFPATAEVLIVLHLKLPNIFFECSQLFVYGRHARGKTSNHNAKSVEENRQPKE